MTIYINDAKKHQKNREGKKFAKRETVVEIPGKCGRRHYDCQVCKTFHSSLFLFMFVNIKVPIRGFLRVRNICNILISNWQLNYEIDYAFDILLELVLYNRNKATYFIH